MRLICHVLTTSILATLCASALAQPAAPERPGSGRQPAPRRQSPAARPTADAEAAAELRAQWEFLFAASIAVAKQRGVTPAEHGAALGGVFAAGWPPDLTPTAMAQQLQHNLELLRWPVTVQADAADAAVVRFQVATRPSFGVTPAEWDDAIEGLCKAIASARGLSWQQTSEGGWQVVRVTRSR